MTDVLLEHEADGGNIECVNGQITLTDGLEVCVYTALFGGNELDSGDDADTPREWWGNKIERIEARKYRSRFQHLVQSLPITPANLPQFEDAAGLDLQFLVGEGLASYAGVNASIPALNTVKIDIAIIIDDVTFNYVYTRKARERAEADASSGA